MDWKIIQRGAAALSALALLSGCGSRSAPPAERTAVRMMYWRDLPNFERYIEDTCPGVDLQIERTTTATANGDSERRLRNGHGPSLVVTTLPTGGVGSYVADLSAEDYSSSYQATMANRVTVDGQVRFLPLPGQYGGYILNKTLAERLGCPAPAAIGDVTELMASARERNMGVGEDGVVIGLSNVDRASFGTYIVGTQVPDFLGLAEGAKWFSEFQEGTASFSGAWDHCMDLTAEWSGQGYLSADAATYRDRNALPMEQRMADGTLLLAYGNTNSIREIQAYPEAAEYEYVMLPFLSGQGNQPWVLSFPDAYIGINASVTDGAVRAACSQVLRALSTQEGQAAWMSDTGAVTSYLTGYQAETAALPPGLEACVESGYVYQLRLPSQIIQYLGDRMWSVLTGASSISDALAALDDYCVNGSEEVDFDQSLVGTLTEDLLYESYNTRREETAIGNLVADAIAEASGAEIAVANGGGIRASLYRGDVYGSDLSAVCPYQNEIVVVEASGSTIWEMLENSVSLLKNSDGIPSGRFLQVSGLHYAFRRLDDSTGELVSVSLPDGTPLEMDRTYTVAVTSYMAGAGGYLNNNGDGYTMLNLYSDDVPKGEVTLVKETGLIYTDALRAYFAAHQAEEISAKLEGRVTLED